jgi:hypothetical protein
MHVQALFAFQNEPIYQWRTLLTPVITIIITIPFARARC